jgi:F0F1-type ATP synthase membrane subunit b/b'
MEIIPDLTAAAWLTLPFLVSLIALTFVLSPTLAHLEAREQVRTNALTEAGALHQAADHATEELEASLVDARRTAGDARTAEKAIATEEETKILAAARIAAEAKVAAAVAKIAGEKDAAAMILRGTAKTLSGDIAAQVLGR